MEGLKKKLLRKISNEFYCSRSEIMDFGKDIGFRSKEIDSVINSILSKKKIIEDKKGIIIKGYWYNNGNKYEPRKYNDN